MGERMGHLRRMAAKFGILARFAARAAVGRRAGARYGDENTVRLQPGIGKRIGAECEKRGLILRTTGMDRVRAAADRDAEEVDAMCAILVMHRRA
jgi:hypothetical protein